MHPETSIIIVNYNTSEEIKKCLLSIQESDNQDLQVIVVDNASADDSREIIKKFPEVRLIQNNKNLGFARGNNIGAKVAKGEYFFFLNPDTQIKKDTISKLVDFAKKNPNAILGPKILNTNGSSQGSCYKLPAISGAVREYWLGKAGAYEKFTPKVDKSIRVEAIVGAAIFIPKKIFEKLGGFDERYFLYYEDLDLCRKAKKHSVAIYYLPQATVVHYLGKSGGNIKQLETSAKIYHGLLNYLMITFIIRIGLWLKKLQNFISVKD